MAGKEKGRQKMAVEPCYCTPVDVGGYDMMLPDSVEDCPRHGRPPKPMTVVRNGGVTGFVFPVETFVARCDCGWRQDHRTKENAENDLAEHMQGWHGQATPAADSDGSPSERSGS